MAYIDVLRFLPIAIAPNVMPLTTIVEQWYVLDLPIRSNPPMVGGLSEPYGVIPASISSADFSMCPIFVLDKEFDT